MNIASLGHRLPLAWWSSDHFCVSHSQRRIHVVELPDMSAMTSVTDLCENERECTHPLLM